MLIPLALLGLVGVAAAAIKLTSRPNLIKIAAGLNMPLPYIAEADKWARVRKLPLEWVLATIIVESRGRPNVAGDADGRSVGLMQVNAIAHAKELAAAGLSRDSLFDYKTNIEWGTKYLAQFRDDVLRALGGRKPPTDLGEIVRLSYKGPALVLNTLRQGRNPLDLSWAPEAIANWRREMARVSALTRSGLHV